MRKLEKKYI